MLSSRALLYLNFMVIVIAVRCMLLKYRRNIGRRKGKKVEKGKKGEVKLLGYNNSLKKRVIGSIETTCREVSNIR